MKINFFNNFKLAKKLESEVVGRCATVIDLGCGKASPVKFFSGRLKYSLGVDSYPPSITASAKAGIHSEYLNSDILEACAKLADNSFDGALALDAIEHFKKAEGVKLLKEMERIAKKIVIVYTPNGFLNQTVLDNNQAQEHLSGWSAAEMKSLGFKVYGMSGLKFLRKELGEIKYWPRPFWLLISRLSQFPAYYFPAVAFQILCVKKLNKI